MKQLKVKIPSNSYTIHFGKFELTSVRGLISKHLKENRLFIITDNNVKKRYQNKIDSIFLKKFQVVWLSIPAGEQHKRLKTCENLLTTLSQKNATRDSMLLALGGGVVGDITGFVAATYMRGIDYFQMPTTLLAQVDSSVGGKTGVDLPTGKNLVGAFYQPKAVFILTDFLNTLSQKQFKNGLAEVIKYGLIADAKLFDYLNEFSKNILNRSHQHLTHIVYRSCQIKADVVRQDEKEANLRMILNFGHTLGHAIEMLQKFKGFLHGEAVAIGMLYAAKLSAYLDIAKNSAPESIKEILDLYKLPTKAPKFTKKGYQTALMRDKKAKTHNIRFILIEKIGKVKPKNLDVKTITQCL